MTLLLAPIAAGYATMAPVMYIAAFAICLLACTTPNGGKSTPADTVTSDDSGTMTESATETGSTGDSATDTATDTASTGDTAACTDTPTADAGPDQVVDLGAGVVQLDCTASGGCGSFMYTWAIQAKPAGSSGTHVDSPDAEDPTFTPDAVGNYTFSCAVYDGTSWSRPDMVRLTVH